MLWKRTVFKIIYIYNSLWLFGIKYFIHWSNLYLLFVFEIWQICKMYWIKCITGPVPERDYILSFSLYIYIYIHWDRMWSPYIFFFNLDLSSVLKIKKMCKTHWKKLMQDQFPDETTSNAIFYIIYKNWLMVFSFCLCKKTLSFF